MRYHARLDAEVEQGLAAALGVDDDAVEQSEQLAPEGALPRRPPRQQVVRRLADARLLVAGDPAMALDELRGAPRVEWRLGYLSPAEFERALSDATIAIFPYRAELDQSGALLQSLGAGIPAVVYDVGGLAEPIARYGAGRVVPAGDVEALTEAIRTLLDDRDALDRARAGAEAARSELTWDASAAAAHVSSERARSAPARAAASTSRSERSPLTAAVRAWTSPAGTTRPAPKRSIGSARPPTS